MFENFKKSENIKKKYKELKCVNKRINILDEELKPHYKKQSDNIQKNLKELISIPITFNEIEIIEENKYKIINSLLGGKLSNEKIYIDILNIIKNKINNKGSFSIKMVHALDDTFDLLDQVDELVELLETEKRYLIFNKNLLGIYENILKIIEEQNSSKITIISILIKNIKSFITDIEDIKTMSYIIELVKNTENNKKIELIHNIFRNFSNTEIYNFPKSTIPNIITLLKYIEKEIDNEKIYSYLNTINKAVFVDIYDDYPNELLINVLNLFDNYVNNKEENINLLCRLLNKENFVYLQDTNLQNAIIEIIMSKEILDKEYANKFINIICIILDMVINNNDNVEIGKEILNKLRKIETVKSLDIILNIYPFINKFCNETEFINIMNTIDKDDKVKKLVINIKE